MLVHRIICTVLLFLISTTCLGQVRFNFIPDAALASRPGAVDALKRAGEQWSSQFTDAITLNISVSSVYNYPSHLYATASPVRTLQDYDYVRGLMVADAADESSNKVVQYLPTWGEFSAITAPNMPALPLINIGKPALKALGVTGLDEQYGMIDGSISVSFPLSYDFDNRDGVSGSTLDFESLMAHEIGHCMGFHSCVDDIDYYKKVRISAPVVMTQMDLFRFKVGMDPNSLEEFRNAPRYLNSGGDAIIDDLDNEYRVSTGYYTGDGFQAAHWKYGYKEGAMVPTIAYERIASVRESDLRMPDLFGFDRKRKADLPEPATLLLLLCAVPFLKTKR